MRATRVNLAAGCVCLAATAWAGCVKDSAPPADINFELSSQSDLSRIGRVVFVELVHQGSYSDISRQLTSSLFRAIQARRLFHVSLLDLTDCLCRDLPLTRGGPYSLAELSAMRAQLGCDAVLIGRLTDFQPHPRMQVGLYLSLIDLRSGKLVWGVDHIWDTTDRIVEQRLKRFFKDRMRSGYDPASWRLATMSPRTFGAFVAHEVAETLAQPMENLTARAPADERQTLKRIAKSLWPG